MVRTKKLQPRRHSIARYAILLTLIAIGVYLLVAVFNSLWPFKLRTDEGKNARTTQLTNDKGTSATPGNAENSGSVSNNTPQTVAPPPIVTPSETASFPIQNSHYKIEQTGSQRFDVTLYAILNSPAQYADYESQLKQYKQEVLTYLQNRFSGTSNLDITWTPSDAKDL